MESGWKAVESGGKQVESRWKAGGKQVESRWKAGGKKNKERK